jgi:hypothetical protein
LTRIWVMEKLQAAHSRGTVSGRPAWGSRSFCVSENEPDSVG